MSVTTSVTGGPRWASAPGETIRRVLSARGLTEEDLADALAMSDPEARRLMGGERQITSDLAGPLAALLGSTETFWMERDAQYRKSLSWLEADDLVRRSPVADMVRTGWIEAGDSWKDQAQALLDFYGVQDVRQWRAVWGGRLVETRFRKSAAFESDDMAVAAWLRRVELEAGTLHVAEWSPTTLRSAIPQLRALTKVSDPQKFLPAAQAILAAAGVALVVVPALQGNRLSGAASQLSGGRRMVALTGRHLAEDHLWFTIFHELGHLLLHPDEPEFLDDFDEADREVSAESEADRFAQDSLIPRGISALDSVRSNGPTMRQVVSFAAAEGVSPGVVVGQLHHAGILRYDQLRRLIRGYKWDGPTLRT